MPEQRINLSPQQIQQLIAMYQAQQSTGESPQADTGSQAGGLLGKVGGNYLGRKTTSSLFGGSNTGAASGEIPFGGSNSMGGLSNIFGGSTSSGMGINSAGGITGHSAGGGLSAGTTPTSGLSGAGMGALGAAGAYGLYDTFSKKKHGGKGAAQGALSGAALGFALGGPIGALIGGVGGGGLGAFGNFGDKDRWKTEGKAMQKLKDQGYAIPDSSLPHLTHGQSMDDLRRLDAEREAAGHFTNAKFRESRNEADLTPLDIQGYASIFEKSGKSDNVALRMELAKRALLNSAVNEHHGTVDVDWSKVKTDDLLDPINGGILKGKKLRNYTEKDYLNPKFNWQK